MASTAQSVDSRVLSSQLPVKTRRPNVFLWVLVILLVVSNGSLAFIFWRKANAIEHEQKNLQFSQFVTDYNNSSDFVLPQVNTIQFLRRGFSVDFDTVKYTQEGLLLSGTIGNGTELYVSTLAVSFTARPYPYQIRDRWEKAASANRDFIPWWFSDWNIGSGQSTVGTLNPGSSAPFSVTIPNVKQTSDTIEIAVSFSGERYLYLK